MTPNPNSTNTIMDQTVDQLGTSVVDFYTGKSILITGATGFVGKVLLEKLLSTCPNIGRIYLLIRASQDGTSAAQRAEHLFKSQAFSFSRNKLPIDKVVTINGDMVKSDLGLSAEDRKTLLDNVSIVFHIAANVKFHGPMKEFVQQNVLGTESMMELANEMNKLESFVYVSTAYSNCNLIDVEEKVYPLEQEPKFLMEKILLSDSDKFPSAGDPVLMGRPNSYTASKAIAENVIQLSKYKHLPLVICRPSIVAHSIRDPVEGWCDSLNGLASIQLFAYLGILRTMNLYGNCKTDIIPVDFVANSLIVIGWHTAAHPAQHKPVIHLTTGMANPITWSELSGNIQKAIYSWPTIKMVRPFTTKNLLSTPGIYGKFKHFYLKLFLHYLFAYFYDMILLMNGAPRVMLKTVERMHRACDVLAFFSTNQWSFHCRNYAQIYKLLSKHEQKLFLSDVEQINWLDYTNSMMMGNRRYLLKEDDSNIKVAKLKQAKLVIIYKVIPSFIKISLLAVGLYCAKIFIKSII